MNEDAPSRSCAPPLPPELYDVHERTDLQWHRPTLRTRIRMALGTLTRMLPIALSAKRASKLDWGSPYGDRYVKHYHDGRYLPPLRKRVAWVVRSAVRTLRYGIGWMDTR